MTYIATSIVSPVGTPSENGFELLAALTGIHASATAPALLKLEPGIYDIGPTSLAMRPFVDIEGSGELTTKIVGTAIGIVSGVVMMSSDSELRAVTVENVASPDNNETIVAVQGATGGRLTNATLIATNENGVAQGIQCYRGASPSVSHVRIFAYGRWPVAIENRLDASPIFRDVEAVADGGDHGGIAMSLRQSNGGNVKIYNSVLRGRYGVWIYAPDAKDYKMQLAHTQIIGTIEAEPSQLSCVGAFTGTMLALGPACD